MFVVHNFILGLKKKRYSISICKVLICISIGSWVFTVNWLLFCNCALLISVSEFTSYLKGLSPSSLDMELRMLQILEEDDDSEVLEKKPEFASISLLLDYFIHETSVRNNFEFIQALVKLFLKVWFTTVVVFLIKKNIFRHIHTPTQYCS